MTTPKQPALTLVKKQAHIENAVCALTIVCEDLETFRLALATALLDLQDDERRAVMRTLMRIQLRVEDTRDALKGT